ncbi:MAG: hypothetical protein ABS36_01970 [Acidobacteria bacterium SCN 69-37]|nr:MAG: hypothetical protein ABS36_01970 [Acidobacteria bacterium SCN 69-37]
MITATDRLDEVLARDPRLMTVLAQASPAFATMSRGELPRTMARLVTVEQAARVAGIAPAALIAQLNHALAHPGDAAPPTPPAPVNTAAEPERAEVPEALRRIPADLVVECDVREELRAGAEPFARIMAAARSTPEGGLLKVWATFEPAPLYAVLAKQRFSHFAERMAADDWCVWFHREAAADAPTPTTDAPAPIDPETDIILLDVRGLEPPEPMVRTLEALATMPRGKTLVQINVRVPQFLIPKLEERGFTYDVREQSADLVRIFIRHTHP